MRRHELYFAGLQQYAVMGSLNMIKNILSFDKWRAFISVLSGILTYEVSYFFAYLRNTDLFCINFERVRIYIS
jgi:hypothetical protein